MSEQNERIAVLENEVERLTIDIEKLTTNFTALDKTIQALDKSQREELSKLGNEIRILNTTVCEKIDNIRQLKRWVAGLVAGVLTAVITAYILVNVGIKG